MRVVRLSFRLRICVQGLQKMGMASGGHAGFLCSEGSMKLQMAQFPSMGQVKSRSMAPESPVKGLGSRPLGLDARKPHLWSGLRTRVMVGCICQC